MPDDLPPPIHEVLHARALRLYRTIEALWDTDRAVIPHLIYGLLVATYWEARTGTL